MRNLPAKTSATNSKKKFYILWAKQNISASQIQAVSCQFVSSDAYTYEDATLWRTSAVLEVPGAGETPGGGDVRQGRAGKISWKGGRDGRASPSWVDKRWFGWRPFRVAEQNVRQQRGRGAVGSACCFEH